MNTVEELGYPPHREVSEDGEIVHIDYNGFVADVMLTSPFGPDVVLLQPMKEGTHILGRRSKDSQFAIEHTADAYVLESLWSVVTVALAELDPGYCAARLRQLEGEEVARQEAGQ